MADARVKIDQIRNWMTSKNIDAYLVPRSDRYQGEYVTPSQERLKWLTNFTGSHGVVAILQNKAALFVSGMYTLQSSMQIDTDLYQIVESPPASPMEWLGKNLKRKSVIGFDPMLFTASQIALWRKAAAKEEWVFQPIEENAIDQFWFNKPADPVNKAVAQKIEFAGETTESKVSRIVEEISEDAHHLLISEPSMVSWLLNMRGQDITHTPLVHSQALLDKENQITLFVDQQKITPDLRTAWGNHVAVEDLSNLLDVIAKINKPLQIDPLETPYAVKAFCDQKKISLIETSNPAIQMRAQKNKIEIDGAIKAHEIDAQAFADFTTWFKSQDFKKESISELDIVAKLHELRKATGQCVDDSFDTIAGYGPNGAIIHYNATEETNLQLKENSLLLLDSGGQYHYGTTDVTRVFALGAPTKEMKTHYTAVLKGLINLSMVRFPEGTKGGQLDSLARAPIWELGLNYAHGTGHGVGSYLSVHEWPRAAFHLQNLIPLLPGMILSIEPGIYIKGQYGIRLENLVVVIEDKRPGDVQKMLAFKTLTKIPFENDLIDFDLMNENEKAFLKQF